MGIEQGGMTDSPNFWSVFPKSIKSRFVESRLDCTLLLKYN
jgi:hypothetical protein